jgi:hypothetical protein
VRESVVKIAVIQHRLRATGMEDAEALLATCTTAAERGAEFVLVPDVPAIREDGFQNTARSTFMVGLEKVPGRRLIPQSPPRSLGIAATAPPPPGLMGLGRIGVFVGDSCIDPSEFSRIAMEAPMTAVFAPAAESELQAEAMLELAVGLSDALAALVMIAETAGAEAGAVGHGGSAILFLGEVLAEAIGQDDDLLFAEIEMPVPVPEPREPLPAIPLILQQRLAQHQGRKVPVDYPADLD